MIEFYPEIRLVHVAGVLASGALVLLRGVALFAGTRWARAAPLRYLGYTVDSVWLTAALILMNIVEQFPVSHGWLTMKVGLLVVYLALVLMAFGRGAETRVRLGCWVLALGI